VPLIGQNNTVHLPIRLKNPFLSKICDYFDGAISSVHPATPLRAAAMLEKPVHIYISLAERHRFRKNIVSRNLFRAQWNRAPPFRVHHGETAVSSPFPLAKSPVCPFAPC